MGIDMAMGIGMDMAMGMDGSTGSAEGSNMGVGNTGIPDPCATPSDPINMSPESWW